MIKLNLQYFAKEGPGGEKTEKPTTKKRQDARKDGQVAKSQEINTAFLMIAMFTVLKIYAPYLLTKFKDFFVKIYSLFDKNLEFTDIVVSNLIAEVFKNILLIAAPMLAIAMFIGIVANLLQVGWHPTAKPMRPKFSKLNPKNGIKKLCSLKSLVELAKTILKLAIIVPIIYVKISKNLGVIYSIYDLPVIQIAKLMLDIACDIGISVGMFFIVMALGDYIYNKYDHEQNIKMTKQEVKDEYKNQEGNPEIKSKIRQKMREVSMRRMMQDIPHADVIITNPTHFAVAISYDSDASSAPLVVAKGADYLAAKIKKIAKENEVQIIENKPLARTLYYTVDIGDEVPPELYQAVAEVLAFVYSLKNNT